MAGENGDKALRNAFEARRRTQESEKNQGGEPRIGQLDADDAFEMDLNALYALIARRHGIAKNALYTADKKTSWSEIDRARITLFLLEGWIHRTIADQLYIHQDDPNATFYDEDIRKVRADLQEHVARRVEENHLLARQNMYLHPETGSPISRWRDIVCRKLQLANPLDLFPGRIVPPTADFKERRSQRTLEDILYTCYRATQGALRAQIVEDRGLSRSVVTQILNKEITKVAKEKLKKFQIVPEEGGPAKAQ